MLPSEWTATEKYICDLFVSPDPVLDAVLASSAAADLPAIQVAPSQGKWLMLLARLSKARKILEIGTLAGYSAICLARALPPGGRLITLESEVKHADIARANIARAGLADVVEVRLGPAQQTLVQLRDERQGPFDMIFIDADKPAYPEYLRLSLELSRPGTLIVADNVVRKGKVTDPNCPDANVQAVRRFNEMLAAEPRVQATILQTVGSKDYDGFALALVVS